MIGTGKNDVFGLVQKSNLEQIKKLVFGPVKKDFVLRTEKEYFVLFYLEQVKQ